MEVSCRGEMLNADIVKALQARGMIRKAEAKWPGQTNYLNATELGSDPRAIHSRPILRCVLQR